MGKKKSLSDVQRARIIALHGQILSELQIFPQMRNSRAAMHQEIAKCQQDGSYTDKKKTGRPQIATAQEDHIMRRIVMKSPTSSMKEIFGGLVRFQIEFFGKTLEHKHKTDWTTSAQQIGLNFLH